ncbi:unnamed protein product [Schistosoma mattheei]|uniref:Uncharacterized protein n=1 Tax=Schistosoma mattheei TaxID=31246 RepID=A0A183Q8Q3_9TREM|nr:unnamed protein product [Schistosoma mattheei]
MLCYQVTPHPNVWKANISTIQECAAKTDWFVDTSSSVEESWSVFKGKFSLVTSSFIPYWYREERMKIHHG